MDALISTAFVFAFVATATWLLDTPERAGPFVLLAIVCALLEET